MCGINPECNCDNNMDIHNISQLLSHKTLWMVDTDDNTVTHTSVGELQSQYNAGQCSESIYFVNNIPMALQIIKDHGDFKTYPQASKAMRVIE